MNDIPEDGVHQCDMCRDPEQAKRRMKDAMKEYGWIVHLVQPDDEYPYGVNYHTHGLPETYNHPDLQIVLSLDPMTAHKIICTAVDKIKNGARFDEGEAYDNILANYKVKFILVRETDRQVLRMILPDKEGRLDILDIDEQYQEQYQ